MTSIDYSHFSHISELTSVPLGGEDSPLLQSVLELHDHALFGRVYDPEHNPYGMPAGRKQELVEDYIHESQLIIATRREASRRAIGAITFHAAVLSLPGTIWINGIAVDETYRRQSIGRNLIERAEKRAQILRVGNIALRSTPAAIPFYERLGFTQSSEDPQPIFFKHLPKH